MIDYAPFVRTVRTVNTTKVGGRMVGLRENVLRYASLRW